MGNLGRRPATLGVLIVTFGSAASAQTPPPAPIVLPDLVVSGERVVRSVAETTSSVSVTPAADITTRRITDLTQILRITPNVALSDDNREVVIRGIPATGLAAVEDVATLTPGSAITTFLDGVPISTWGGATSTWDIDRVEVFRGPQTTVSGRGSLAGAIFLNSADPTATWTGGARAGAGSQRSNAASAFLAGPLVKDRLGLRLSIDRQESRGFIDNVTTGTAQNPDRHVTARGKLVFMDGADTRVVAAFTHSDRRRGGGLASLSAWPDSVITRNNQPERLDKTVDVGSLSFSHALSDAWRIEGLTGLGREDATRLIDGDITQFDLVRAKVKETADQLSQEVRFAYDPKAGPLRGFIGAYARAFSRDTRTDVSGLFTLATRTEQETRTYATFGEATYALVPGLRLTAGGRVEVDTFDVDFTGNAAGPAKADGSSTTPLPRLSIAYDIVPNVTVFATGQRAYRAGGAAQTQLSGTAYTFDPEYAWVYETGLRTRWLGGRLEVNGNVFHANLSDQQVEQRTASANPFDSTIVNAGRSTQQGVEVEARFLLTDDLTGFANGALLRTRFDEFTTTDGDFKGNRFPFASPWSVGGGLAWRAPFGVTLSGDANLQGAAYSDIQNTAADKLDTRLLLNLTATYPLGPFELAVFARNLLDETYATRKVTAFDLVAPGPKRFIGTELRGTF